MQVRQISAVVLSATTKIVQRTKHEATRRWVQPSDKTDLVRSITYEKSRMSLMKIATITIN